MYLGCALTTDVVAWVIIKERTSQVQLQNASKARQTNNLSRSARTYSWSISAILLLNFSTIDWPLEGEKKMQIVINILIQQTKEVCMCQQEFTGERWTMLLLLITNRLACAFMEICPRIAIVAFEVYMQVSCVAIICGPHLHVMIVQQRRDSVGIVFICHTLTPSPVPSTWLSPVQRQGPPAERVAAHNTYIWNKAKLLWQLWQPEGTRLTFPLELKRSKG